MADRILFDLDDDYALGADSQQWIIFRVTGPEGCTRAYRPIAFIPCTKTALIGSMQRKKINLTPEAQAKLDAMPELFKEWRAQFMAKESQ